MTSAYACAGPSAAPLPCIVVDDCDAVELLVVGCGRPRDPRLRHRVREQSAATAALVRWLARWEFGERGRAGAGVAGRVDAEALGYLALPGVWVVQLAVCPRAVALEPGVLAWRRCTR
jgi:hypothetical protein